jgi:hypothetical protein
MKGSGGESGGQRTRRVTCLDQEAAALRSGWAMVTWKPWCPSSRAAASVPQ